MSWTDRLLCRLSNTPYDQIIELLISRGSFPTGLLYIIASCFPSPAVVCADMAESAMKIFITTTQASARVCLKTKRILFRGKLQRKLNDKQQGLRPRLL